ncbi:MAG: TonB-dependent receptor [Paludibacteraceae bacterium]|nr:TonB-dependent receptor [Paludibacteraceae bacterium]
MSIKRTYLIVLSVFCMSLCALGVHARNEKNEVLYTISGYVFDAGSGERLIGATLIDTISRQGCVTNEAGFFSLTLSRGMHALIASYVGYELSPVKSVELTKDIFLKIRLRPDNELTEIVVSGQDLAIGSANSPQMSAIQVSGSQVKNMPSIGGIADVMKAVKMQPGVQSGGDGSSTIYVRGGGPDQNLILLDGVPLYNVNHAFGLFSVFNADAVKTVTLYKGNFPARYGSRLSSIIDVRTNEGSATGWHAGVQLGLLSTSLNFEGPIFSKNEMLLRHKGDTVIGRTRFKLSARRTHYDALLSPIMRRVVQGQYTGNNETNARSYFYDVNAKISHAISDYDKLIATFYMGDDDILVDYNKTQMVDDMSYQSAMNQTWSWGNIMGALKYEHIFSSRLFSKTQVSATSYQYTLSQNMHVNQPDEQDLPFTYNQKMRYRSNLIDLSVREDLECMPNRKNLIRMGVEYAHHRFSPLVTNLWSMESDLGLLQQLDTAYSQGESRAHEIVVYAEDNISPNDYFSMNIGLRTGLYIIEGKTYPNFEPRLGARVRLYKDLNMKVSASYMNQFVHLLSNSMISNPSDLWVPVTKDIPPMSCVQAAAALAYQIPNVGEFSIEGYYKRMWNLLEYKEGASFFGSATDWQDKVVTGIGWSYGVEFLFQRKVGAVTGWLGYTWSRSMRQFDQEGMVINFGKPFHAKNDREHDISLSLQYQINRYFDISGSFVYGTGARATLATQNYYDKTHGDYVEFITERNNYQMPDYHRLDLGCNIHIPSKKAGDKTLSKNGWLYDAEHLINISVYNVYCRQNPYMMYQDGMKLMQISLFPVLPSISYSFSF